MSRTLTREQFADLPEWRSALADALLKYMPFAKSIHFEGVRRWAICLLPSEVNNPRKQETFEKAAIHVARKFTTATLNTYFGLVCTAVPMNKSYQVKRIEMIDKLSSVGLKTASDRMRAVAAAGDYLLTVLSFTGDNLVDATRLTGQVLDLISDEGHIHEVYRESIGMMAALAMAFVRDGSNVFDVSPSLASSLLLTDVPADVWHEARMPFTAIYLQLPEGAVPFCVDGSQTWANGIWLIRSPDDEREKVYGTIVCQGLGIHFAVGDEDEPEHLRDGLLPDDMVSISAAQKLVQNFLVWLESCGKADCEKEVVPKKLAEKRSKSGRQVTTWLAGRKVKLSHELRRAAREQVLGRSRAAVEGWRVRARFIVRGHWRNQAVGEGRKERKRIWIQAFWKGPQGAEAWQHVYVAESGEANG